MSSARSQTWYRIALSRAHGTPALVAAQGEHLGAALAAAQRHVSGSTPIACALAADGVPLGESVGRPHVVELGDATEVDGFRWPAGVLPRLGATDTLAVAGRGWIQREELEPYVLEAQTDADHLVDLFLGMVERLPAADNLEVRLLDHFESTGVTDVWLTSRVDAKRILRFLDDHEADLIDNGHVELSIYVREHRATLRLTEHKTVVWISDREAAAAATAPPVTRWLAELDVDQVPALVPIARVPHFHHRGAKTRDRKKLGEQLFRHRLRRVDRITVAPAPAGPDTDG